MQSGFFESIWHSGVDGVREFSSRVRPQYRWLTREELENQLRTPHLGQGVVEANSYGDPDLDDFE